MVLNNIAGVIARRSLDHADPPQYQLPSWSWIVILANVLVFLPIVFFVGYTLNEVFPVLAMVEDENPPAYEPVSLNDDTASVPDADAEAGAGPLPRKVGPDGRPAAVSSSVRTLRRTLHAQGGWRSYFRGLALFMVQGFAVSSLMGVFSSFLPGILASVGILLAYLALIQLPAAWVHIIMTPHSPKRFWQRLPPFKRTFNATAPAITLYWAASQLTQFLAVGVAYILGLPVTAHLKHRNDQFQFGDNTDPSGPKVPALQGSDAWKTLVVVLVALTAQLFLVLPAHVTLVRVQASLLPGEEDTVVPFDRSFQGTVEPALVGGKGYATLTVAWKTFSRSAWRRLVKLYVKLFLINIAAWTAFVVLLLPSVALIMSHSTKKE